MRTKAFRRSQRQRIQNRRADDWGGNASSSLRNAGMIAKTPHPCSSWCCGNPRRHFKGDDVLTVQERRQREREAA